MKPVFTMVAISVGIVALALVFFSRCGGVDCLSLLRQGGEDAVVLKTYDSELFGLRFQYPAKYYLEEKEPGDGHRWHSAIILTEETEENRLVREGKSPGREGPISISVDLYQSPETLDPVVWMKGHSASNFKLSDDTYTEIIFAGKPAVSYSWDGLYRADNVAVSHHDYMASFVVTYITPEDAIRDDFQRLLEAVEFRD